MKYPILVALVLILVPWTFGCEWSRAQAIDPTPHARFATGAAVTSIAFDPEPGYLITGDAEGRVHVWDLESQQPVQVNRLDDAVVFVGALPGDTTFAAVSRDGRAVIRTYGGKHQEDFGADERADRASLDAVGRHLAILRTDGRVDLRRVSGGAHLGTLETRDQLDDPVFVGFDALGQQVAAVSERGEAVFWNPVTQRILRQTTLRGSDVYGSRSKIHAIASRPDAGVLVAGVEEVALPRGGLSARSQPGDLVRRDVVLAYDWERAMEIGRMEVTDGQVTAVAVGPGPDHVAVARQRHDDIQILDLRAGQLVATVATDEMPSVITVSSDDRWLAAGLSSGEVAVWKLALPDAAATARADQRLPSLSGRVRIVGEDTPVIASTTPATVAVLPFEGHGAAQDRAPVVAEMLTAELANVDHLTLVERLRIEALLDELALQEQGITRDDGVEIGRMLQADYVILGSLDAFESSYLLNARLLDVETAEVVSGRQVVCEECRATDLVDAIRTLSATLAQPDE